MFAQLDIKKFVKESQDNSKSVIQIDRDRFTKVYDTIINYIQENDLLLSNINYLLEINNPILPIIYNIYCENPHNHSIFLSNVLHKKCGKWVRMSTNIDNQEYTLFYDTRMVAKIYIIKTYKEVSLNNIILPIKKNVNLFPPEIELISVYHDLYSLNNHDNWSDILILEKKLLYILKPRCKTIMGGVDCKKVRFNQMIELKLNLLKNLYDIDNNYILIGSWLFGIYNKDKVQIISTNTIQDDIIKITKFLENYSSYGINYKEQRLHIPKDFRTVKYTIYIQFTTHQGIVEKPFIDIFNCGKFELIPYNNIDSVKAISNSTQNLHKEQKIGNLFVVLRFLIIDLWIIRIIEKLNLIPKKASEEYIVKIFDLIFKIRYDETYQSNVFGLNVVGINKPFTILKNNSKSRYPYYPEIFYQKNKKYLLDN